MWLRRSYCCLDGQAACPLMSVGYYLLWEYLDFTLALLYGRCCRRKRERSTHHTRLVDQSITILHHDSARFN